MSTWLQTLVLFCLFPIQVADIVLLIKIYSEDKVTFQPYKLVLLTALYLSISHNDLSQYLFFMTQDYVKIYVEIFTIVILSVLLLYGKANFCIVYCTIFVMGINCVIKYLVCFIIIGITNNMYAVSTSMLIAITIISKVALGVTFFIYGNTKLSAKVRSYYKYVPKRIYILILITITGILGVVAIIMYFPKPYSLVLFCISTLAMCISLTSIILILIMNTTSNLFVTNANKVLEKQIQNQLEHYEKMNVLWKDYLAFKHDYVNHMNCIKSIYKAGNINDLNNYIDQLDDKFPVKMTFFTGNYLVDSILSEKQDDAVAHSSEIDFSGTFDMKLPLTNTDLCIILTNAIDNAIECCSKLDGKSIIKVNSEAIKGYFLLTISNPCKMNCNNSLSLITTKSDKTKHGFGIGNIEKAVDNYNGKVDISTVNNQFIMKVIIKL